MNNSAAVMDLDTTGTFAPNDIYAPDGKNYERHVRMEIVAYKRAIKKIDAIREPLLRQERKDEDHYDSREHIVEHRANSNLITALNIGRHELVERLEREQRNLKRCEAYRRAPAS